MEESLRDLGVPSEFGRQRPVGKRSDALSGSSVSVSCERTPLVQTGPEPPFVQPQFPVTSEYQVKQHSRQVTGIAFDSSGSRMFTGSADCSVKYWNFGSMKIERTTPEVSIELDMSSGITGIDYNGKVVLVGSQSPEIGLYDLSGLKKGATRRGDMYLYDITKTYGHVAPVNGVVFSKSDENVFASCSADGTVRVWDVKKLSEQRWLFKLGEKAGPRVPADAIAGNGDEVVVAGEDGCVYVLGHDQMLAKFSVGGAMCAVDAFGEFIATRLDDSVAVWDRRNHEKPVCWFGCESKTGCVGFSPDGRTLMLPEMVHNRSIFGGSVRLLNLETATEDDRVMFPAGVGARCCKWHPQTNQIAVGCSDGITRVLFDFSSSHKGVLLSLEKGITVRTETDAAVIGNLTPRLVDPETERVITVGGTGFWFPYTDAEKRDKRAAQQPKAPIWGEGHHGQIATHPRQVQLRELQQVDEPDDTDIVESLRARNKEAQVRYFTSVKDRRPD